MSAPAWVRNLGLKVWQRRRETDESLRAVAAALGLSPSTLSRIERGLVEPDTSTLFVICKWLDVSVNEIKSTIEPEPNLPLSDLSTPDIIEVHLRADRDLPAKAAQAIAAMVRAAYQEFAEKQEPAG